jgi:hypothetical protein
VTGLSRFECSDGLIKEARPGARRIVVKSSDGRKGLTEYVRVRHIRLPALIDEVFGSASGRQKVDPLGSRVTPSAGYTLQREEPVDDCVLARR